MDIRKHLFKVGVPEELHDEAVSQLESARIKAKPMWIYKLLAPFIVGWLLYFTKQVPWDANKMPERWWKYDNNISINGDGWGTMLNDGSFLNYVDQEVIARGEGVAISYSDPLYNGDTYYCKGYHPRSELARWIWLGWRNRASAFAQSLGDDLDLSAQYDRWGVTDNSTSKEGMYVNHCQGLWQMREHRRVFFGKLCLVRNMGHKINNAFVENKPHAMIVWITFSLKGWNGK